MFNSFAATIVHHARVTPDKTAVTMVRVAGHERDAETLTYVQLHRAAAGVARRLLEGRRAGDRVLLLHPTGLDFVVTFVGCLYAGIVPVPAPAPANQGRADERTTAVAADAQAGTVLTGPQHVDVVTRLIADSVRDGVVVSAMGRDDVVDDTGDVFRPAPVGPEDVAFLQYTSGSASDPKGVVVTQGSLVHNLALIRDVLGANAQSRSCSWLPLYHDMGLVGMLLAPLWLGGTAILMSPTDFLRRPHQWLALATEYRAVHITAPNFAYDLCARHVTDEQLAGLDLSRVRHALSGAEPIDAATIIRFTARFAPAGFRPEAFKPCYGMAEATLLVTCTPDAHGPVITPVDQSDLERGVLTRLPADADAPLLVSSGRADGLDIRVVDPRSREPLPDGQVGEIWVRGPSVASGYWNRPEATLETFHGVLSDGSEQGFLRTGDLGVLRDQQLYVTGRIKDMIIIHGRNLHPHDIERDMAGMHDAFRGLQSSVCSVPGPEEQLVVMQELRTRGGAELDLPALAREVRVRLGERLGVRVPNLVFLRPGQVLRTSSGKVRRARMRELFMTGGLAPVYEDLDVATSRRYRPRPCLDGVR
ncbi:fatty acyl-AMP ligase [Frankia sp. CiP3]|uniref:fatty acyl-AMP ligase n=1 Tax=Frankia sp. CiP3 TaxID=2880971 RepID=UPI001EF70233|nr:fatty acyl-AMP ligase [Frankia sp. CiP3]